MRTRIISFAALLALAIIYSRCAVIIHGSRQDIVVVSEPKKANIEIDGMNVGITPYKTRLKRGSRHTIKVQLAGYNDYEIELKRKLDGWIFGNILLGGVIGLVVDVATGSMYRLSPGDLFTEMKKSTSTAGIEKDQLYLSIALTPKPGWEKIGQMQAVSK